MDRVGHEGQLAGAERGTDQRRLDVEDPVSEAVRRAGRAVVRLVGVQHMDLAAKASSARAAVAESLHAGGGDSDRIGVVAMGLERARRQVDLGALDPLGALAEPDRVRL